MFRRSGYRFTDKNMRHSYESGACPDSNGTGHALGASQQNLVVRAFDLPVGSQGGERAIERFMGQPQLGAEILQGRTQLDGASVRTGIEREKLAHAFSRRA